MRYPFILLNFALLCTLTSFAQTTARTADEKHCGTLSRLELKFKENPALRARFESQKKAFTAMQRSGALRTAIAPISIPVIFHIVMEDPNAVTDAQIQAQLDTLNKDFAGQNADSVRIPSYFKSLFGKSAIQFCRAQRSPDGDVSNGVDRISTTRPAFTYDDKVKHILTGGAEAWNTDKYFNVWITTLSDDLLGYATFPNDGLVTEQGVVIDYRTLPGGSLTAYNEGKTLTHESGHYFNLNHIWGDDFGDCSGSDDVTDTPNQADATSGTPNGIVTDNCTVNGSGIMYQNFMDYTNDQSLVMFTTEQVTRMESALTTYRSGYYSSNGCAPVSPTNYNSQLRTLNAPATRLCAAAFVPVLTFRNKGSQPLTSLRITAQIDNGTPVVNNWTGNLATGALAAVSLSGMTAPTGTHTLKIYSALPSGQNDEEKIGDTLTTTIMYTDPVGTVSESFEVSTFPPTGWDIVNPDNSVTWSRVSGLGKTGFASIFINNSDYDQIGEVDDIRLPNIAIDAAADSAFLSFQVAAATYSPVNTSNNNWDTLQVLVSKDCGKTYTSVYKKWGATLVTHASPVSTGYTPAANEWRKDSISLQNYIGAGTLLIAIRNTTGFENNIYLDDINLRTVSVNPNLKSQGFLVTPSPTSGSIAVQFYPQPTKLKSIQVFSATGQLLQEKQIQNGLAATQYQFDLTMYAAGVYTVRAVFTDRVLVKKILKVN